MDWTIFQSHHTDNEEKPSLEENAQAALVVKITPARAGDVRDVGSIPGSGRSPGGGHGNPLQYCCLKNPMDRGPWWATVHRVTQSQTRLSMQACMPANMYLGGVTEFKNHPFVPPIVVELGNSYQGTLKPGSEIIAGTILLARGKKSHVCSSSPK